MGTPSPPLTPRSEAPTLNVSRCLQPRADTKPKQAIVCIFNLIQFRLKTFYQGNIKFMEGAHTLSVSQPTCPWESKWVEEFDKPIHTPNVLGDYSLRKTQHISCHHLNVTSSPGASPESNTQCWYVYGEGRPHFMGRVCAIVHLPQSWVQQLGHIASASTNLDQISSPDLDQASTSKSQPNISISTKLKSKYWPNLVSESRPRFNFLTATKHQRQKTNQTPASKFCLNFNFKILSKPCAQSLNKI